MKKYNFKLANDETWFLLTDKTLKEVKQEVSSNKWIKLNKYSSPKEFEIQTCNIVYISEVIDYQKNIDEQEKSKEERLGIIKKIESYKFNFKMRWWYFWNVKFHYYLDKELEHPLLTFNKEYLSKILNRCKKYKCKKRIIN